MKKIIVLIALFAGVFVLNDVQAAGTPDYKKLIIGTWTMDMGAGMPAIAEYKADGSFIQKMGKMTIDGTYSIKANNLIFVIAKNTSVFTILSIDSHTLSMKNDKNGKTEVYNKKN